jgi:hypothetical protein
MERPVIISACGPALEPYWKRLAQDFDQVLLADPTANALKQASIPGIIALSSLMPPVQPEALFQVIAEEMLEIDWAKAEAMFKGEGFNAKADLWLKGYVMRQLAELMPRIMALDNLISRRKVVGVLVHEDITNETNYLIQWAKLHNIPSVHVTHGGYGYDKLAPTNVHAYLAADWCCTWNDIQKSWLVMHGADPEHIFVTGPGHNDKWSKIVPDKEAARKTLGLEQDKPLVVYLGTFTSLLMAGDMGGEDAVGKAFELFLQATKHLDGWQILANAHPGRHQWTSQWHASKMRELGVKGSAIENHIELCIQAADVLCSGFESQAMTEAGILNTPSVVYSNPAYSFIPHGEFIQEAAATPEGIAEVVRATKGIELAEKWKMARNKAVYDVMYLADGKATDRVMAVLKDKFRA